MKTWEITVIAIIAYAIGVFTGIFICSKTEMKHSTPIRVERNMIGIVYNGDWFDVSEPIDKYYAYQRSIGKCFEYKKSSGGQ